MTKVKLVLMKEDPQAFTFFVEDTQQAGDEFMRVLESLTEELSDDVRRDVVMILLNLRREDGLRKYKCYMIHDVDNVTEVRTRIAHLVNYYDLQII